MKRSDPFSNAHILAFIVFCVMVQKYFIPYILVWVFGEGYKFLNRRVEIVLRQTILAIELLFVIIPTRHNFALEYMVD